MTTLGKWELDTVVCADALELLAGLPDASVNCCVTSPPYFGLRDYGVSGQIGLERSPSEYVTALVNVFREVRRVLRDDGTFWLNLGDSYTNMNRTYTSTPKPGDKRYVHGGDGFGSIKDNKRVALRGNDDGLKEKDLMMIPARVALALQADGWILRSDIIWHTPNAMPESVTDRPTLDYEHVFLLAKSARYFYDADAIREPYTEPMNRWGGQKLKANGQSKWDSGTGKESYRDRDMRPDPAGRNKRAVWSIPTQPFHGAHYAVMPEKLVEPCVLAGCPVGGIVIDPFAGMATVGVVALKHGRRFIGGDISAEYVPAANARLQGRFEEHEAVKAGLPYTLPMLLEVQE